jgi:hypothetical protein
MKLNVKTLIAASLIVLSDTSLSAAATTSYRFSDIPKNLLVNAKAVVRKNDIVFEILTPGKATENVTYAVTILNENGIDESLFLEFYNKFLSIRNVKITVYNSNGEEVKNLRDAEVRDYSAISGYSIYEDERVKYLNPHYRSTPFTVEYKYVINYNGLLSYPEWRLYEDYNISLESSSIRVIAPQGFKFRHLEQNIKADFVQSEENGKSVYSWKAGGLPALRKEIYSSPIRDFAPAIFFAPDIFEIDGYSGNAETWSGFGRWISDLGCNGSNELSTETRKKMEEITSKCDNDRQKIKLVYKFMQDKVRYVSIQEGIGGWKPFGAETVDRLSYGDCKALANFMKSLLSAAGIKSFYTLVMAGKDAAEIKEDFSSNQFNHAIICVPLNNDTIWLECTDQHIPCGYTGTFTDDRQVLLTGSAGGVLVRTRHYSIDDNVRSRTASVSLQKDGSAKVEISNRNSGFYYDDMLPVLMKDDEDKKKDIQSQIPIPGFSISKFSFSETDSDLPSITEKLELSVPVCGSVTGARLIINPNLFSRIKQMPGRTGERFSPIVIRRPFREVDTVSFNLPEGFMIERPPAKKTISSKFGSCSYEILPDTKNFKFVRTLNIFKGYYPVSDYNDFVDFFEKVYISDESKISLTTGA